MILSGYRPEVSVIAPAHNEADNLPTLINEIAAAMQTTGQSYEIVIIDDSSSDGSAGLLRKMLAERSDLVVYRTQRQSGQSTALSIGFDIARGDVIVTIDADLQNDPADIPNLIMGLQCADVVIGWRRDRKDTLEKKIISKCANFIRNWFTGETVRDTGCGLKVFKKETLERMHRFDGMHRFFPTLVKMHGYTVAEIPVRHRPRQHGNTHYNIFNRSIRPMMDLLAVRWLQKRTLRYPVPQIAREHAFVQK